MMRWGEFDDLYHITEIEEAGKTSDGESDSQNGKYEPKTKRKTSAFQTAAVITIFNKSPKELLFSWVPCSRCPRLCMQHHSLWNT